METVRIRDTRWKEVGSGIRDKHPGSATLLETVKPLKTPSFGQIYFKKTKKPQKKQKNPLGWFFF